MNDDADKCFTAFVGLLQEVTGCDSATAVTFVEQIALRAIHWGKEQQPGGRRKRDGELWNAWVAGFESGRKELGKEGLKL